MRIKSYIPGFDGFYNSVYSPENEAISISERNGVPWDSIQIDVDKWQDDVARAYVQGVRDKLAEAGIKDIPITYEKVWSPRFYNYDTDLIYVTYTLHLPGYAKLRRANLEKIKHFPDKIFKDEFKSAVDNGTIEESFLELLKKFLEPHKDWLVQYVFDEVESEYELRD